MRAANGIFSTIGITIEETSRNEVPAIASQRLLLADFRAAVAGGAGSTPEEQRNSAHHWRAALEASGQRFRLNVAELPATGIGLGVVHNEAMQILLQFRSVEIPVFWAPGLATPGSSSGHALIQPLYRNLPPGLDGIFMGIRTQDQNTLAHELGHVLMQTGHCQGPASHPADCDCANTHPENLMYWDGAGRSPTPAITNDQRDRIRASPRVTA